MAVGKLTVTRLFPGSEILIERDYRSSKKTEKYFCVTHTQLSLHVKNENGKIKDFLWSEYDLTWTVKKILSEMPADMIRFITPRYEEIFRIRNHQAITIKYPDGGESIVHCEYIDNYHTRVGYSVFHICEFAEKMLRNLNQIAPETIPQNFDKAIWKLTDQNTKYISIQKVDSGYDYTLYDSEWTVIDGGQIDDPDAEMWQVRYQILKENNLHRHHLELMQKN